MDFVISSNPTTSIATENRSYHPIVYWYLSFRCNLACKHCWVNSSPSVDTSQDMTPEVSLLVIEKLYNLHPLKVVLSGGEPLLRPDIYALLESLIEHRIRCDIESNGTLVTPRLVKLFRYASNKGVPLDIYISLDGGTAEVHNRLRGLKAFEHTLRGISMLREGGVRVNIQCIINRVNVETIPQLFNIAAQYGIDTLSIGFVNPVGRAKENFGELGLDYDQYTRTFELIIERLSSFHGQLLLKIPPAVIPPRLMPIIVQADNVSLITSCAFPTLGILPDGTVAICALTRLSRKTVLGDAKVDSLVQIWSRPEITLLRQKYERADLKGVCADCVFRHHCKGSCRAYAFVEFGTFQGPYPLCAAFERDGNFPAVYRESWRQHTLASANHVHE